jgi:cGMP-dependent protein kinase 2
MYERNVQAGEILINEGDTGLAATELYIVKSGIFEVSSSMIDFHAELMLKSLLSLQVLQRRQGQNVRVNLKQRGDCFGEISLMYDCARNATVAATVESVVWVMDRAVFR